VKRDNRQPQPRFKIAIEESVLEFLEAESLASPRTETGGVVAGRGSLDDGAVVLTHASGPGPRARRTRYSFARDKEYCQTFLDRVAVESGGEVDYLGEWHKHHEAEPRPSGQDIRTAADIAADLGYHVRLCLLLIMGASNSRSSLRVFVVYPNGMVLKAGWVVYAGSREEGEGADDRKVPGRG
jgi:integrative and conjugative element protein (TIGR02256 family)